MNRLRWACAVAGAISLAVVIALSFCRGSNASGDLRSEGAVSDPHTDEPGEIPGGDLGKYKRRHTRVFEFLLTNQPDKARTRLNKWFEADATDPENYYMLAVIECQSQNVPQAVSAMKRALDLGLAPERFVTGTHTLLEPIKSTPEFKALAAKFANRVVSGPMVAVVTPSSGKIWVRTERPSHIKVVAVAASGGNAKSTATAKSAADSDLTAVAQLDGLKPATEYRYSVFVNGVEDPAYAQYQSFTTEPPVGKPVTFSIAFGGCAGYTPENERQWDNIRSFKPSALWLLGDNEYIDQPEMPALQNYCFYRRQARPEFRRLVASTPTYAIWDDHDFGTNDCPGGPDIEKPAWKRAVWNVFRYTWINPSYAGGEKQPGCWFDYHYGDVHFIFLDGRYYRSTVKQGVNPPTMLGPAQKKWLLETLAASKSKIKVLISPVTWALNTKGDSPDTWQGFPEERREIFDFLTNHKIPGVLLVSSDRHRSDLLRNDRPNSYALHEFNSGLLTNDSVHPLLPTAEFSYNENPAFGLVTFDTVSADASVSYRIIDINGREHLKFTAYASELQ